MTSRTARWLAVAAVAAFGALHLAMLADPGRRHADEHLYTDAAIRMLGEGDLVTPRAADGTPRFHKPLLTYWVLIASFRLLGVGLFASRLPFLLATLLLAWLTWRLALVWSSDPATAVLAVAILLAQPETTQLATRATPDALLCLFLTACLLGVSRLSVESPPSAAAARWAWMGSGLAVATKGLPGLLGLAYGALFLAATDRLRALLRPGAAVLGMVTALAGVVPPWLVHGRTAMSELYGDQLVTRAAPRSAGWVLRSALRRLNSLALELVPWEVLLASSGRALGGAVRRCMAPVRFGLGWTALLLVLSAVPAFTRPRYMAPALPVLAVVCAVLLAALAPDPVAGRRLRLVARGLLLLMGVGGLALVLAGSTVAAPWVVAGTLTAAAAAMALRAGEALTLVLLGVVAMLASGLVQILVRPTVVESPASALATCLSAPGPGDATAVLVGRLHGLAADLRLVSGGHLHVETVPDLATLRTHEPEPAAVVAPEGIARRLEAAGWRLTPCGRELRTRHWTLRESWNLVRARDLEAVRAARSRRFYVARRTAS